MRCCESIGAAGEPCLWPQSPRDVAGGQIAWRFSSARSPSLPAGASPACFGRVGASASGFFLCVAVAHQGALCSAARQLAAAAGTWCSRITSSSHAEGPGFNPQLVQCVHAGIFLGAANEYPAGDEAAWCVRLAPSGPNSYFSVIPARRRHGIRRRPSSCTQPLHAAL